MKKTMLYGSIFSAFFAVTCLAAPAPPAAPAAKAAAKVGAAPVALKAADGAKLVVNGDSTLHKWHADALELSVTAALAKDGELLPALKAGELVQLELLAKAGSLKSNEGKSMDKNMHKALEAGAYPDISFSLASYEVKGDEVSAKGTLSIHGTPKEVLLSGVLTAKEGGAVNVKGSYDLLMSDYGVKPPVMMLGTVKVKDALTITYDFDLSK